MTGPAHDAGVKSFASDRTGVLIVRLWLEVDHQQSLRARITQSLDSMVGERSVAVAASADDVCAVVRKWVEDFVGSGS